MRYVVIESEKTSDRPEKAYVFESDLDDYKAAAKIMGMSPDQQVQVEIIDDGITKVTNTLNGDFVYMILRRE
jgi:hypothetical protein